jgi:hypothetical protein
VLRLRIADVIIGLESGADGPAAAVDGAASAFLVADGAPDIHVRSVWGEIDRPAGGRLVFDSGGVWKLHDHDGRFVYSFYSPLFGSRPYRTAIFDRGYRRGVVTMDRGSFAGRAAASPLEYPLDELMVINRLAFDGGVELHGCGVVDRDGAGYLFAGQSGAGKSTIARLWHRAGATVVSDDRVVVRTAAGRLVMHGTPWHGDGEFAEPVSADLTRIFLLRQAPATRVVELGDAAATALLFACAFPVFHSADALDRTVALLATIVETVPVDALEFTPTPDAIRLIRSQSEP